MKRKLRLTESQMIDLIKKVLHEQQKDWRDILGFKQTDYNRQEKINAAWCSVNYGLIGNLMPSVRMQWCGTEGYTQEELETG